MPLFIPEWTRASGRQLQVKRVFNGLDETTVVRRPLREDPGQPDFFLEHRERGWLAVAVIDTPFAALDAGQLFVPEQRVGFDNTLASWAEVFPQQLPIAAVMWNCDEAETELLAVHLGERGAVRLLSRERFMERGHEGLAALLRPLPQPEEDRLRTRLFPESEIRLASVARRRFHRDNSARLAGLFLDHQQEWATKLDLELPEEQADAARDLRVRLINGVAGSGKTLIALSRALLLAEMHPDQSVLILIHNTPIVADLRERLHRARGALPANFEIATFSAWAHQQWRNIFQQFPAMPEDRLELPRLIWQWRQQWPDLKLTEAQLVEEFDFLNEALIDSELAYLEANRAGRGFALRGSERSDVWALAQAATGALAARGLRMWSAVASDICRAADQERMHRYDHILVDEAQFFAPSWFQVVKLALRPGGGLFLCADPNQGFMKSRLSWRSAGIDVSGRTKKLRRSYRTTQSILHTANELLRRKVQADPEHFLEPDFAGMEKGTPPLLIRAGSPQDAVDRVANEIAGLAERRQMPLSAFLVIYGGAAPKRLLYERLARKLGGTAVWWLNRDKKLPPHGYGKDYLRLASLETATGLEGIVVFLIGMDPLLAGAAESDDDAALAPRLEADARKLYMAMTRASHRLVLLTTEPLPAPVEALFTPVA